MYLAVAFLATSIMFSSCKDKNEQSNNGNEAQKILGYWVRLNGSGQPEGTKNILSGEMEYSIFEYKKSTYLMLTCTGYFDGDTFYMENSVNYFGEINYTISNGKWSNGIFTYDISFPSDNRFVLSDSQGSSVFKRITFVK